MNFKSVFLLLAFGWTLCQSSFAQRGPAGGAPQLTIKGIVTDNDSDIPLEYSTISLFKQEDQSLVSGNISDDQGIFIIQARPGKYYAQIEYLGYQVKTIEDISLTPKQPVVDLGKIGLEAEASLLEEVVVSEERSTMQMALDKKIFNVGKDLATRGGSAADVLDNAPSVQVDIDGNVSLRGSGNVRVLIDGKPSGLLGSDNSGLRSLQATLIERIEVITNPSAKYEAEGMAGIINIILKKERKKGLNGSFDFTIGYPKNFGTAINLNYRTNKLNFFANYGISYRGNRGGGTTHLELYNSDTTLITDQVSDRDRGGLNNTIRLGADYFFNQKNTLTTAFSYRIGKDENFAETTYRDYFNNQNNLLGKTIRTDDELEDETKLEYSLSYKKTFERKGQEWTFDIRYQDNLEEEGSDLINKFFNPDDTPSGEADLIQRSDNTERENQLILQTDYALPFSKDKKFEGGLRVSFRNIDNDFLVKENKDNVWEALEGLSNNFQYDENIYAAYLIYGDKKGKFSYQVGLRPEYTDVSTKLLQTNEENPRDYINLFPSAAVSYELPADNSMQVSYSRRVRRPRFWDLNPFFTFSDDRNFFSGNPDLDPEFTDSYEINHLKYWEKASLSSGIYYRHTTGKIQRLIEVMEDGTSETRPENLSTEDSFGFEFNTSLKPNKWFRFNADFNFYRFIVDGKNINQDFSADGYAWFTRGTARFSFWKNTDVQLRFNYRAPQVTTQGKRLAFYTVGLAASKDILKDKGTLTLSARDLFNTRRRRYISESDAFFREIDFQWRSNQVTLTLNYRLNQKKKRGGRRGSGYEGGGGEFGG